MTQHIAQQQTSSAPKGVVEVSSAAVGRKYYSGKAGRGWLTDDISEAFPYSMEGAERKAEMFRASHAGTGLFFEAVEQPEDVYIVLKDGQGREIEGCFIKGGQSVSWRAQVARDLAQKHSFRQGDGFVLMQGAQSGDVIEKMELEP